MCEVWKRSERRALSACRCRGNKNLPQVSGTMVSLFLFPTARSHHFFKSLCTGKNTKLNVVTRTWVCHGGDEQDVPILGTQRAPISTTLRCWLRSPSTISVLSPTSQHPYYSYSSCLLLAFKHLVESWILRFSHRRHSSLLLVPQVNAYPSPQMPRSSIHMRDSGSLRT
jgi:hypothetical protein